MVGALLLFFLPVNAKKGEMTLHWKDAIAGVEWGTLLLFGGGLAMGGLMYETGLSDWIGQGIKIALGGQPSEILFLSIFCIAALLLSEAHFPHGSHQSDWPNSYWNCTIIGNKPHSCGSWHCTIVVARIYDACLDST